MRRDNCKQVSRRVWRREFLGMRRAGGDIIASDSLSHGFKAIMEECAILRVLLIG